MDKLFTNIGKILKPNTKIEVHSNLTQHLVGISDIVLWNKDPLTISQDAYAKFKEIIHQRNCKFYTLSTVLPYHDFCISLLCSVEYSLNHKLTPDISARTYASAWRTMGVIADTGPEIVKTWIRKYIGDRSPIGYTNALGEILQTSTVPMQRKLSKEIVGKLTIDDNIISNACLSRKVIEIGNDNALLMSSILSKSTSTPEGQLDSLIVIHDTMRNKYL